MVLDTIRQHLRHADLAKLLRYAVASGLNVVVGQVLLFGAQTVLEWPAVTSNVAAVCLGTVPAYLVARYWVWQKRGTNHLTREVLPFWILALAGFVLSTGAVWIVERRWGPPPVVINLTNLVAYGFVWVAKFLVLERLFAMDEGITDEPLDALVDDMLHPRHD